MLTTFLIGRSGVSEPCTAANFRRERAHLVEHVVHLGHHVPTADPYRRIARSAQRHVQNGALLRDVDRLAGKHGIDPLAQARLLGKLNEQLERRLE